MTSSNRPSTYVRRSYSQKSAIVNRRFRSGDVSRISDATGYSNSYVSEVISGKYSNERIMNRAFDMTRNRKENFSLVNG